jgi:hypothetical protein
MLRKDNLMPAVKRMLHEDWSKNPLIYCESNPFLRIQIPLLSPKWIHILLSKDYIFSLITSTSMVFVMVQILKFFSLVRQRLCNRLARSGPSSMKNVPDLDIGAPTVCASVRVCIPILQAYSYQWTFHNNMLYSKNAWGTPFLSEGSWRASCILMCRDYLCEEVGRDTNWRSSPYFFRPLILLSFVKKNKSG